MRTLIALFLVIALTGHGMTLGAYAALSEKTLEAERAVIANPGSETVANYTKLIFKDYKKAYKAQNYDEALDDLRSALYFLQNTRDTKEYLETKAKYDELVAKIGIDTSEQERLETAKSLYMNKKNFAAGYEFSRLLEDGYQVDVCYEYMGDIASRLNYEGVSFSFYRKAVENNPDNITAKYKFADALLRRGVEADAIYFLHDIIESTNSKAILNDIVNVFKERIEKDPENENNYEILGLAYQKLGQYDQTYQLLRKSLVLNPNDIFLRYHLGNLLYQIQEYNFADEIYSEILEDNPYESQIRISRAKSYSAVRKTEQAIKDYQIVLAMYPDSLQAQYGLYSELKGKMPLEKIINTFYPIEPDYKLTADGYNDLGWFANKLQKTNDALVFFEKSLALNPKSETPYIELYKIYQLQGQNEKAKNLLKQAHKMFPNNQEIINMYSSVTSSKTDEKNNLALSYMNEGEFKKAIAVYQQIEPKNAVTYEAIANCYRQMQDYTNAIANYKKAIDIDSQNSEIYYMLGTAYLEVDNKKLAKQAFNMSLKTNPKNIKSKKMISYIEQNEIGNSLDTAYKSYEIGDYRTALAKLDSAVQGYPNDPKVHYYRALTKTSLGDYKGAIEDYQKTIALDRSYIEAYYNLAVCLEMAKRPKEALIMYEKYLGAEHLDPHHAKKAEEKVLKLGEKYY